MSRGFTLIELLVVIAIIAILAAVLFPVFAQAKESGRQTTCLSNMKQVGTGMMLYVNDHDGTYPTWAANVPPINGGTERNIPPDMQLMPYVKNDNVWKCPSDDVPRNPAENYSFWDGNYKTKELYRSYAYVGSINTAQARGIDNNTGLFYESPAGETPRTEAEIQEPSWTVAWLEQWPFALKDQWMGVIAGSGFIDCDTFKLAGRKLPPRGRVDYPPPGCTSRYRNEPMPGHRDQGHYIFCDGHAKAVRWEVIRKNDFYAFKVEKPTEVFEP